jgi:hypothetical protein
MLYPHMYMLTYASDISLSLESSYLNKHLDTRVMLKTALQAVPPLFFLSECALLCLKLTDL